ncbi:MAG: hypothetical protein ACK4UN_06845 [Limisphaerales bacterium]
MDLYPVTIEGLKEQQHDLLRRSTNISRAFRESADKCPEVIQSADYVEAMAKYLFQSNMSAIEELEKAFTPRTDSVFFFNYDDDQVSEFGWMIVRKNKVKTKVSLGEGVIQRDMPRLIGPATNALQKEQLTNLRATSNGKPQNKR